MLILPWISLSIGLLLAAASTCFGNAISPAKLPEQLIEVPLPPGNSFTAQELELARQEQWRSLEDPEDLSKLYDGEAKYGGNDGGGKKGKLASAHASDTWPHGRAIYYTIDPRFSSSERMSIAQSIVAIQDKTCIRFEGLPTDQPDADYINITTGINEACFVRGAGFTVGRGPHLLHLVQQPWCADVSVCLFLIPYLTRGYIGRSTGILFMPAGLHCPIANSLPMRSQQPIWDG